MNARTKRETASTINGSGILGGKSATTETGALKMTKRITSSRKPTIRELALKEGREPDDVRRVLLEDGVELRPHDSEGACDEPKKVEKALSKAINGLSQKYPNTAFVICGFDLVNPTGITTVRSLNVTNAESAEILRLQAKAQEKGNINQDFLNLLARYTLL